MKGKEMCYSFQGSRSNNANMDSTNFEKDKIINNTLGSLKSLG